MDKTGAKLLAWLNEADGTALNEMCFILRSRIQFLINFYVKYLWSVADFISVFVVAVVVVVVVDVFIDADSKQGNKHLDIAIASSPIPIGAILIINGTKSKK